ncbi:unnamed protein product [Urochloa humidicola]
MSKLSLITSTPTLQLYEFEACPFCRRVREAMTELDLSAEVYPCPKGSLRHREMVKKIGGKESNFHCLLMLVLPYWCHNV